MLPIPLARTLSRTQRALRRGRFARLVVGVWLAVHAVVVAAAPVTDAMAGHVESVVAHWEDAQDTSCPPLHDPATCQLCQHLNTSITDELADRAASVKVVRAAEVLPRGQGKRANEAALRGAPDPRGPPAV